MTVRRNTRTVLLKDIHIRDEIARRNLELAREARRNEGKGLGGLPWLDLDTDMFAAFRNGELSDPPGQDNDPPMAMMLRHLQGEEVLCLAGGGGQQSALFSLCGAKVTVLDLTPEQLELDRVAAEHYGYDVTLVQGDMRDLSSLPADHFLRVCQPISSLYVPDLREVFRGVARVLKPGGLYYCDYTYPVLYMAEKEGWDGEAYVLRFSQPHRRGRILERPGELMNFEEGEFFGEFNHLFSEIINGQIAEGLSIVGVWEAPRPGRLDGKALEPSSFDHESSILPYGLAVVSNLPD